ncbi:winged helix-turn-helix transcriptional regulator [Candidatus Woesearchaeota archaeon]|jgi:DNA-binding transcriptional ArsR family regulator|nr:winged helix-turn-helix transcriptional regulator [Candidatus Woesearchaeota archaeon]MBT5272451.1 winged helix-turn-helix transcriptional regulator [Candidatus Woesearchaeota archaeon]MBT6041777.1 winged helix-turn-helix transcriptional regulator [Candidatus Woesearchaeota archaeon]MBT6336687.1 winged helix-turn-helix transcriptional regulator [Candidatus Woesearchaeota archaeon]MBT7926695.1 winged helix-turn-helix transcriptional regulator [Candidatus Woesearchaeota archaeon]
MAKNNLLLVDLNDAKTKKLAETITSDTSRKILNHLADKDDTEANIAKVTKIPISTVHYHLQKLQDASLVTADEYHYSEKGREVNHYKLANKYIIIAPKKITGLKQKLKNILPVALVSFAAAAIIKMFTTVTGSTNGIYSKAAPELMAAAAPIAQEAASITEDAMIESAPIAQHQVYTTHAPDIALWFLIGAVSAMAIYIVYSLLKDWIRSRN